MKKQAYIQPVIAVVELNMQPLLAGSVMVPGEDNLQPGARETFDWDEWDETVDLKDWGE